MESITRFITTKLKLKVNQQEECGGAAMGAEVSRIQLHERWHTKTADSAESGGPVQRAGAGTDEPDEGCEHRTDGRRPEPLFAGMDWLFREV